MTDAARLAAAAALCRAGRFAEAERDLKALVSTSPADAEVLQLLGIAANSQGRLEEGLAWFDRARAARPGSFPLMQNRAHTLFQLGRLEEARREAEAMARASPGHPAVREILARIAHEEGVAHHGAGRFAEAIEAYRRAIAGGLVLGLAHTNLGNALKMAGRDDEALAQFGEALRLEPESPVALANYGTALHDAGRAAEAVALLERAVALAPGAAQAHNGLGAAYFALGRFADAEQCHRRALALRPGWDAAANNLANALSFSGRKEEALACFRELLSRSPRSADTLANMGAVQQDVGDFAGARASFEEALRVHRDFPLALNNLGYLEREEGRVDAAAALFERSLQVRPGHAGTTYNLALARLSQGRFEEGWALHDARFHMRPPTTVPREFPVPLLARDEIGRVGRVAVWREQGVGDQILYSTTLVDFEARGQEFVLEIDARLVAAVRRAHPRWNVVAPEEAPAAFAGCERHASIGHVAGLLRPTRESFAGQPRSFLAADAGRAAGYRERLAKPGRRLVGVSWRSFQAKNRTYIEARKSAPLDAFATLAARGDLTLLDLQYGDTAAERARFPGQLARLEELDLFNDLDGLLAAIEACDLVVTTSNVTAHLAGAVGKRTLLVFLHGVPPLHYWHHADHGHSLWYPSVELVTDPALDTWTRALGRIDERLRG